MSQDLESDVEVLKYKKRRLGELKKQAAIKGISTPPEITIEIEELEEEIEKLQQIVDAALGGLAVPPAALAGDSSSPAQAKTALAQSIEGALVQAGILVAAGQQHTVVFSGPALVFDPPELPSLYSARPRAVTALASRLGDHTWCAVNGATSTGKTILVRLTCDHLGGRVLWISFSGLADDGASSRLEHACATLTGVPPPVQRGDWYRATAEAVGKNAWLVLDDIPNLSTAPNLVDRLVPFVRECQRCGVRVFSTSLYPIPPSIAVLLGTILVPHAAPPLLDEEAGDILRAYGAPETFISANARFVNEMVRQHPFLLVAASRYLQQREWQLGNAEIGDLLSGTHAADFAGEFYHKLKATVPKGQSRDLLYRLTLPRGSFSRDHVDCLSAVQVPIPSHHERLSEVTNSWVDRLQNERWKVSPLLTRLAEEHLDAGTRRRCHAALAELAMHRQPMDQRQAFDGIYHWHQAGELGKAGTLLMMTLMAALQENFSLDGDPIFILWTGEPLPSGMDMNLRLVVRGLHVALFHRLNKPMEFLIADLERLLGQADERHRIGVAGAVSYAIMEAGRSFPSKANQWLRRFLQLPSPASSTAEDVTGDIQGPQLTPEFPVELLASMLIAGLSTAEDVGDWLETLAIFPEEQRVRVFDGAHGQAAAIVVADQVGATEKLKPVGQRKWPAVAQALGHLAERARQLSLDDLWSAFLRAKITVQAEFCKDIGAAEETAKLAIALGGASPGARFLIAGNMGRQEILVRRYADARTWLQLASENDASSVFPHERMLILLAASHAFGLEDSAAGVRNASLAVEVADGSDFVPAVERARAYSELAVAEFIADGAAKAFASWDKAARYLLDSEARGDEWKDLTVIFGHVSGYLARVAETGKPPSATKDGSAYAAPERGIFLTTNPERINYYNPRHEGGLCQVIAFYADAVGAVEQAAYWKARAKSLAMTHALAPVIVAASRDEIPNLLRKEGFAIALAQARKTAQGLMVCCREWDAGRDPSRPELDIAAAFGRLGEDDRRMTEDYAGIMGLMPSVLLVARIAAEGNQEQAREKARSLAAACREIAPTSAYPELWSLAADSVERAYADGHPHYQMLELRKMFPKPKPISLDAIGLLAATAEATPEQAIGCMLGIMPTLCSWYRPNSPAFREILLPFVETYWTAALRDRKFLFSYGATVEGQLPQARLAPERERVASVLRAVRAGFRFREALPPEIQRWLHPDQSVPG